MADPKDPLGILKTDAKQLNLISEIYGLIAASAGDVATAMATASEEQKKIAQSLGLINERNETLIEAEKKIDGMYKDRAQRLADNKKGVEELLGVNKKLRDQELQTQREKLTAIENNYKIAKEQQKLLKETADNEIVLLAAARDRHAIEESKIASQALARKLQGAALIAARKENDENRNAQLAAVMNAQDHWDLQKKIVDETEVLLNTQANTVTETEKTNKGYETSLGFLDGMIEKTGFFSEKWKSGPLGGLTDFMDGSADLSDLFGELKIKASKINMKNLSANMLLAITEQTIKFMIEFDKLAASFRKNTGIIDRGLAGIEQRIVNVQRANIRMGVTMDEAFASANALTSGMAQFTSMTDKAQSKVLQTTALMQEFGISASTTSEIFNTFSKGLGYSAQALENLGTQIMGVATSLKVPPQIIATEFNAASKELMKYGGDMMGVFKGLAEQSKQTGVAIGELMGIVKQFDTFRGAGEAVGKLNAILGGPYLNAINMLYATEEDRVKMLRESIQLSGRQFEDLSRFEQQAIANAAGINDMAQAAKLFGGTSSEFANSQMSIKEMQKQAAKAQATMDKFKQVMMSFAIALGPVVTVLGAVAEILIFLMNPLGNVLSAFGIDNPAVINGLGAFTVLLYGVAAAMILITKGAFSMAAALSAAFWPVVAGVATFVALNAAFEELGPMMRIIAGLAMAIAGGFVAVAAGMAMAAAFPTGGLSLAAFAGFSVAASATAAGTMGVLSGLDEFAPGKPAGQQVDGGYGIAGENGPEAMQLADGRMYMITEPSVLPIGTQDTIYNNADTRAMLSGQGGGIDPALAADLKASSTAQLASARSLGEIVPVLRALAERPIHVDAHLDGKKNYKNQKKFMLKDPSFRIV